jgi:hypothetical protein
MTLHLADRARLPRSRAPPAVVRAQCEGISRPNVAPVAGREHH